MESDHDLPSSEKRTDVGGDDHQGASVVVTTPKSYECNFCKRGFSNAQALGGHMNIHRKDKAKLKQQSSLDIHHQKVPSLEGKKSLQKDHVSSRDDETKLIHMKQLPLFEESPTRSENQKPQGQIHDGDEIITRRALSSNGQGSSLELDLELRLGLEPHDSSAAKSTRKFFS
ncbi:hypothetical protein RIF29_32086 [Crotalaria pallida]|uniref:C2H2-type domain-containing protein n=1 Tax=Crotalaria pallida TaxID=3830 RepID=A0AAN9HXX9_CROPI